jgi:hypothetical protein
LTGLGHHLVLSAVRPELDRRIFGGLHRGGHLIEVRKAMLEPNRGVEDKALIVENAGVVRG